MLPDYEGSAVAQQPFSSPLCISLTQQRGQTLLVLSPLEGTFPGCSHFLVTLKVGLVQSQNTGKDVPPAPSRR